MTADEYPLLLIPGKRVAEAAEELRDVLGLKTVDEFLDWVDAAYQRMVSAARAHPSDIVRVMPEVMATVDLETSQEPAES